MTLSTSSSNVFFVQMTPFDFQVDLYGATFFFACPLVSTDFWQDRKMSISIYHKDLSEKKMFEISQLISKNFFLYQCKGSNTFQTILELYIFDVIYLKVSVDSLIFILKQNCLFFYKWRFQRRRFFETMMESCSRNS